jgi:hypothetical protein
MNISLTKCSCSHCDGHLEFDTAYAGQRVACPHCGMETLLYIPVTAGPPPILSPAPLPTSPAVQSAYRLADENGPRSPAPRPTAAAPRNTGPRNTNPFARQAAKASWISFIFALVFDRMCRAGEGHSPLKGVFLLTVALFVLLGFAFAVIALFGIRQHGTKGILVPGVIGLVLNGVCVVAMLVAITIVLSKRHELQERKRQAAASLNEYVRQVKSGALPTRVPTTGDANLDAAWQIMVELSAEIGAVVEKMDAEIAQLQKREVRSVLTDKGVIKVELGKRTAGQTIIQKHQQDAAALVLSAKQRYIASQIPLAMKQNVLRELAKGGGLQAQLDERFSLSVRLEKAEFDLLQFLYTEFGRYRLINEEVRFAASPKQEEYHRLSQRLQEVSKDTEAFNRRQSEMLEALPDRVKEPTK